MVIGYIDDFLLMASTKEKLLEWREIIEQDMNRLGLIREESKGHWEPTQSLEFLGLILDTESALVRIPQDKLMTLKELLPLVIQNSTLSARTMAKIAGKIICLSLAFSPARIYTRELYKLVDAANRMKWEWNHQLQLTAQVKNDAQWLLDNLDRFNGRSAWKPSLVQVLNTDASMTGWGATLNQGERAGGNWTTNWEMKGMNQHISRKELMAVYLGLKTFQRELQGKSVILRVDNQNVQSYMENGGGKLQDMVQLVRKIWNLTVAWDISIYKTEWLSSEENHIADQESRITDHNEWTVAATVFRRINQLWGPFSIDRFASHLNHKTTRFNSWRLCPGTEAVDCFTQDWKGENNFVVPPLNLIHRVINHIQETRAFGVLIVPVWESQAWWPQLMEIMTSCIKLPPAESAFLPGPSQQVEPWLNKKWDFLAVQFQG